MSAKPFIYIHQRILTHYKTPLFNRLIISNRYDFVFIAGVAQKNDPRDIPTGTLPTLTVKNIYFRLPFFKKKFYWQSGLIRILLSKPFSAFITGAGPYNITSWIVPIICKIRNIPLMLWSIGVMSGEKRIKKILRTIFLRPYDIILLYGNKAKEELIKWGFNENKLLVIYNSVGSIACDGYNQDNNEALGKLKEEYQIQPQTRVIIHLGSLTKRKKIEFLLDAIRRLKEEGKSIRLFIIGAGDQMEPLKARTSMHQLQSEVTFTGEIYDNQRLSLLIRLGDLTVLPGNGGLAVIQSLAYGTPVLIHNNISNVQGPEVEAIIEGKTGVRYCEGDIDGLLNKMKLLLYPESQKNVMKNNCINMIKEHYTPEYQEKILYSAIERIISRDNE